MAQHQKTILEKTSNVAFCEKMWYFKSVGMADSVMNAFNFIYKEKILCPNFPLLF